MALTYRGVQKITSSRDEDGFRTYKVTHLLGSTDGRDTPAGIYEVADIGAVGATFALEGFNDSDPWAWLTPAMEISEKIGPAEGDIVKWWQVVRTYTTKPLDLCQDKSNQTDPFLMPPQVSGDFTKYTEEATHDRFGNLITNSAWEQIRGPQVEFDKNRLTIRIQFNVPQLPLALLASYADTVNAYPLWGFPARCIKMTPGPWSMKFYAFCQYYFTVTLTFEVRYDSWDRDLLDIGTAVLRGRWGTLPGEGCTLSFDIATVAGTPGVLQPNPAIIDGGGGYPANTLLRLSVTPPSPNPAGAGGGVVAVQTNVDGEVVHIVALVAGGQNYPAGFAGTRPCDQAYIPQTINGLLPDRMNPSHFIEYRGPDNKSKQVTLNGAGYPSGTPIPFRSDQVNGSTAQYFVLIDDTATTLYEDGSVQEVVPGGDDDIWVALVWPYPPNVPTWGPPLLPLPRGALRRDLDNSNGADPNVYLWVQTLPNGSVNPPMTATTDWKQLGKWQDYIAYVETRTVPSLDFVQHTVRQGVIVQPRHWRGAWLSEAERERGDIPDYGFGDVVRMSTQTGVQTATGPYPPGIIHVEKYDEVDFTLLGIPLVLPGLTPSVLLGGLDSPAIVNAEPIT